MSFIKSIVLSAVISQLSLGTPFALAADAKAVKLKTPSRQQVVYSAFDFIVRQSAMVTSLKDFDRHLLYGMKKTDRKAVIKALAGQKEFPTFKRAGETLIVDNGIKKFELQWPDIMKNEFTINGVAWRYEAKKPFLPQYEALEKLVAGPKKNAFLFDQLVPTAEALFWIPVLMMLVGAAVGVIGSDLAAEGWCWGVDMTSTQTQKCIDLKRSKEAALFQDAPALDAVSNQAGTDSSNILAKYEAQEWKCPTNNDGKEREYRGRLRMVETKDGKTTPTSNWFNVSAKFSPEGFPTDIVITRDNADPAAEKTAPEKLVIHITFDPSTKRPISYRVPNPNYNAAEDLLSKPTLTLMQNQKLSPEQADSIEQAKDLIRYINYRNYHCVTEQIEENQELGIPSVSPADAAN